MTTTPEERPPRVVVIAGPNGSGKSSLTEMLRDDRTFPQEHVNPDEIERSLSIEDPMERSQAAVQAADARREALFQQRADFAFETVFSHPSKILFLERLQQTGYRVILYYVTTSDPRINIARVRQRVIEGGHPVPEEKIAPRYARCHQLFPRIVETANEAFVYDASHLPAEPVFERVNGEIGLYPGLTAWAKARLLRPLHERAENRRRAVEEAAAAGAYMALPDEMGGVYAGPVRARYRHYVLQTVENNAPPQPWIRHDRALIHRPARKLTEGRRITLRYRDGWASQGKP